MSLCRENVNSAKAEQKKYMVPAFEHSWLKECLRALIVCEICFLASTHEMSTPCWIGCSAALLIVMTTCADTVTEWYIRNNLFLNANKTEAIVTGTRQVAKCDQSNGILVSGVTISFIAKLRVLGVTLDSHLSFDDQITDVVRACNKHCESYATHQWNHQPDYRENSRVLHRRRETRDILWSYAYDIKRQQRVQNVLGRSECVALYRLPVTHLWQSLHWLRIRQRITYKIVNIQNPSTPSTGVPRWSYCWQLTIAIFTSSEQISTRCPEVHEQTASCAF